jgi:hypothetical protein
MAAPVVYSEATLANYLASQIEQVAGALGWDAGSVQVIEAVNDALLDMSVTDISSVTDIRGLRALGRRAVLRAAEFAFVNNYGFTDVAQQTFNRQHVPDNLRKALDRAESECLALGLGAGANSAIVSIYRVSRPHDPYIVLPDSERVP